MLRIRRIGYQSVSYTHLDVYKRQVDISAATVPISELSDEFDTLGEKLGLKIHVMHEDVFNSMHRI